ncbi:MAG TPA: hypothetical protein VFQ06_14125 [Nitrospira sp.]|nr:hypothetical protein [Nitrospira sp.]
MSLARVLGSLAVAVLVASCSVNPEMDDQLSERLRRHHYAWTFGERKGATDRVATEYFHKYWRNQAVYISMTEAGGKVTIGGDEVAVSIRCGLTFSHCDSTVAEQASATGGSCQAHANDTRAHFYAEHVYEGHQICIAFEFLADRTNIQRDKIVIHLLRLRGPGNGLGTSTGGPRPM